MVQFSEIRIYMSELELEDLHLETDKTSNLLVGDIVTLECHDGYELIGNDTLTVLQMDCWALIFLNVKVLLLFAGFNWQYVAQNIRICVHYPPPDQYFITGHLEVLSVGYSQYIFNHTKSSMFTSRYDLHKHNLTRLPAESGGWQLHSPWDCDILMFWRIWVSWDDQRHMWQAR